MNRLLSQDDLVVLRVLLHAEAPLSVHALSHAAEVSIETATAAISRLSDAGCRFDRHPQHGHKLLTTGIECWSDYLESADMLRFGRRVSVYRQTSSTQDAARRLIAGIAVAGQFDGHIIAADHQTAGRGRLGRTWLSQPGEQLLLTAIVADTPHPPDRLMLATAVAVSRCVERLRSRPVELRWPNDVYINDAKLAGILVETVSGAALVGIGVNVANSPSAHAGNYSMTSLNAIGPRVDRLAVLEQLCESLSGALELPDDSLAESWRSRSGLGQQRVTLRADGRELIGRVLDIDPSHGLIVEIERGPVVTLPAASTSIIATHGIS
jgi:BirA family biotin operon repressor/biotin-[acetyl-CoA-carboxylase] ligase